ncbi:hypothetical protein GCM10010982_20560 [Bowmanella pacifica]|uniref:START domain-containing protein n=2 Tax=Bowmanella pacifica TaxID=502051 RepID=A0A917YXM6_9ALTE|nr:hypothetical protein GCM10010982_20560 [Bowmanella pacifica]
MAWMQFSLPVLLSLLLFSTEALADCEVSGSQWQHVKSKHQIELYRRKSDSAVDDVMAKTLLRSDLSAFILLLRDTEQGPKWIANARQITLLDRPQTNQDLVHSVFNAPWPIRDRDLVTRSHYEQDPDSLVLTLIVEDASESLPKIPTMVRLQGVWSSWTLTPFPANQLEICYQGSADAAGNIPHWLANRMLLDGTFKTFVALRKILPNSIYQNKPLRGIQEPTEKIPNGA